MPFFEPLPPIRPEPAPDEPSGWRPPLWDRPSEALLGAPIDAAVVLGKSQQVAIVLDNMRAYPNGFEFSLAILRNPMAARGLVGPGFMGFGHPRGQQGPRIGFEFSNETQTRAGGPPRVGFPSAGSSSQMLVGRSSGSEPRNPFGVSVDDQGVPVEPVLMMRGGGGGGDRFEMRFWCFPLPPPGPMTIFAEWSHEGIYESATPFDADKILAAIPRVVTLWEAQP
jgi:hypothetical protein